MDRVDLERVAVVGAAVATVAALFLVQKHTTPHPRRATRSAGSTAVHDAPHGQQSHTAARAPSQSRSRAASSHRSRHGQKGGLSSAQKRRAAAEQVGVTPINAAPVTPLTANALQQHRQREGKMKAVEEHLEGAAVMHQLSVENYTTVSNAATTGTNQNGEGDPNGDNPALTAATPSLTLPPTQSVPHDVADKSAAASSGPHSRKHTARPKTSWKHASDQQSPPHAVRNEEAPGAVNPPAEIAQRPPPPLAAHGQHECASPADRSHSFLHLSDLGFSPITAAEASHTGDNIPGRSSHALTVAQPVLPAPLSVLAMIEQEINTLVLQVARASGSLASWMALYTLAHQLPLSVRVLCHQSSGSSRWSGLLRDALRLCDVADDTCGSGLARETVGLVEGQAKREEATHHFDWSSALQTAVVLVKGPTLSTEQLAATLLLPSHQSAVASQPASPPPRASSPSRFAALLLSSSSSSSGDVANTKPHTASAQDERQLLEALAEKYRYLLPSEGMPTDALLTRSFDRSPDADVAGPVRALGSLKDTPAFAALRRQPEYAVFACDFVDALGQLQRALDHHQHAHGAISRPSGPTRLQKAERGVAALNRTGTAAVHTGNVSYEVLGHAGEAQWLRGGVFRRSSSRKSSDAGLSPLQPRKPKTAFRVLAPTATDQEPVSPPTSRTVPAKVGPQPRSSPSEATMSPTLRTPTRAAQPNVFERLYTPPKAAPKASPPRQEPANSASRVHT